MNSQNKTMAPPVFVETTCTKVGCLSRFLLALMNVPAHALFRLIWKKCGPPRAALPIEKKGGFDRPEYRAGRKLFENKQVQYGPR